jgi:hypothetical protein
MVPDYTCISMDDKCQRSTEIQRNVGDKLATGISSPLLTGEYVTRNIDKFSYSDLDTAHRHMTLRGFSGLLRVTFTLFLLPLPRSFVGM